MLYLVFILALLAVVFAVVWFATRAKEAATDEREPSEEPPAPPR